jgi:hypothetical protein
VSSDSCVAILATKIYPDAGAREYRVRIVHAVENLNKSDRALVLCFLKSPVFEDITDAIQYGVYLEEKFGTTEHGAIFLQHPKDKTWDEIITGKTYGQDYSSSPKKTRKR